MLCLKEDNLKNDSLLFQVKVMFFTAQPILQLTAGNMLPPPVLEIHLILLSLRAKFNLTSSCWNMNSWHNRVTCEWTGEAVCLVKSTKTRREARKEEVKAVFQSPFFVTRRRSALWRLHLSAIPGTSSARAANPSLLSGNNLSRRYLSSCQNLEGRNALSLCEKMTNIPPSYRAENHTWVWGICAVFPWHLTLQTLQLLPRGWWPSLPTPTDCATDFRGDKSEWFKYSNMKVPAFMLMLCSKMNLLKVI